MSFNKLIKDSLAKLHKYNNHSQDKVKEEAFKLAETIFGIEYFESLEYVGYGYFKIRNSDFSLFFGRGKDCFLLRYRNEPMEMTTEVKSMEDLGRGIIKKT